MKNVLFWFRNDLRISYNHSLSDAAHLSLSNKSNLYGYVIVNVWEWKHVFKWGMAKSDYYLRTLDILQKDLQSKGIPLHIHFIKDKFISETELYQKTAQNILSKCKELDCQNVYWNVELESWAVERDKLVGEQLHKAHISHISKNSQCAVPVGSLFTKSTETPFKVFSQYKKSWAQYLTDTDFLSSDLDPDVRSFQNGSESRNHISVVPSIEEFDFGVTGVDLERVRSQFPAGETAAKARLLKFIKSYSSNYHKDRNVAVDSGASRLSAPLAIGSITTQECLKVAIVANGNSILGGDEGLRFWISELCWREFYRNILHSFPWVGKGQSFKPDFEAIPWRGWKGGEEGEEVERDWRAWCDGKTGFPIVDAAMRQLKLEGWLANRPRMIVAMFLTKDLFIHWRRGEEWFSRHLIDFDYASNNGGWQWSSSTGTDSQPYFRIFNPLLQSRKFDSDGSYIRKYVPELSNLGKDSIHSPFQSLSSQEFTKLAYPKPIVDHSVVKERVLECFQRASDPKQIPKKRK